MSLSVIRRGLWRYVNIKIKRLIHHYHVFSIINILIDEMTADLLAGKEIKVYNLGTFKLKDMSARRHYNVSNGKIEITPGRRVMRLYLVKRLRSKLCKALDIDKLGME